MLGQLSTEGRAFWRSWWCRGHGLTVLALLALTLVFSSQRELMALAGVGFLVGHTATAVRQYLAERRLRISATVIAAHTPVAHPCTGCPNLVFSPTIGVPAAAESSKTRR